MTIGQIIKLYRKEKEFIQGQLAELIGVSTQVISKWETDAGMPAEKVLRKYVTNSAHTLSVT